MRIPQRNEEGVAWIIVCDVQVIARVNWRHDDTVEFDMNMEPSTETKNNSVVHHGLILGAGSFKEASLTGLTEAVMDITHQLLAQAVDVCGWGDFFAEKEADVLWH
jgi:hypothetical protein